MLYDVPTHDGYKVLTHTSQRRFAQNGFSQVGNELFPKNPVNPQTVRKSAIYNKNISGLSEAGYGRRYPYYGLSYPGAGSPRGSVFSDYRGAGSPRSSLAAYRGAGSPRTSLAYPGAGSPRGSVLADAYINDNVPPGTLKIRPGISGRPSTRVGLSGLADDEPGLLSNITSAFGSLFNTAVKSASDSGQQAIDKAIQGGINPPPAPVVYGPFAPAPATSTSLSKWLGVSGGTLLLAGVATAYFLTKK